mmetsp:Transcript_11411/g.32060  ORF Transcript_11411/g.32060 Transcript_11411/m.32060 type:complete len:95 (-) Transcript_11411:320-604(-)
MISGASRFVHFDDQPRLSTALKMPRLNATLLPMGETDDHRALKLSTIASERELMSVCCDPKSISTNVHRNPLRPLVPPFAPTGETADGRREEKI